MEEWSPLYANTTGLPSDVAGSLVVLSNATKKHFFHWLVQEPNPDSNMFPNFGLVALLPVQRNRLPCGVIIWCPVDHYVFTIWLRHGYLAPI